MLATAHDMSREYRVISALAGTAVPVPGTHLLCTDAEVLGAPFYVMDEVPGTVYRSAADSAGLGRERARAMSFRLVDVLAELHGVDPGAVGLATSADPRATSSARCTRWFKQFDASRSREIAGMDELQRRLAVHQPTPSATRSSTATTDWTTRSSRRTTPSPPSWTGRWPRSATRSPTSACCKVYWEIAADIPGNPVAQAVSREPGFPGMDELAERYAARTGLDLTPLPWYTAFAGYKLAVIAEGIHFRYTQGKTVGEGFDHLGAMVPLLVASSLDTLLTLEGTR